MLRLVLFTLILPALVAGGLVTVEHRRGATRFEGLPSVALGLAYLIGHYGAAGLPGFPPPTATQSLFFLVIIATVFGATIEVGEGSAGRVAQLLRLAFIVLFLGLLLRAMALWEWEGSETVLWAWGLSVLLVLHWTALRRLHETTGAATVLLAWGLAFTATSIALTLSRTALLGQLAGVTAAAVGGMWLARLVCRGSGPEVTVVPLLMTLHAGLLLGGAFYADLQPYRALALGVAPFGVVLASLRSWKSELARAAAVAVLVLAAVAAVVVPMALEAAAVSADYYDYYD